VRARFSSRREAEPADKLLSAMRFEIRRARRESGREVRRSTGCKDKENPMNACKFLVFVFVVVLSAVVPLAAQQPCEARALEELTRELRLLRTSLLETSAASSRTDLLVEMLKLEQSTIADLREDRQRLERRIEQEDEYTAEMRHAAALMAEQALMTDDPADRRMMESQLVAAEDREKAQVARLAKLRDEVVEKDGAIDDAASRRDSLRREIDHLLVLMERRIPDE
jgi:hypothetical protein